MWQNIPLHSIAKVGHKSRPNSVGYGHMKRTWRKIILWTHNSIFHYVLYLFFYWFNFITYLFIKIFAYWRKHYFIIFVIIFLLEVFTYLWLLYIIFMLYILYNLKIYIFINIYLYGPYIMVERISLLHDYENN